MREAFKDKTFATLFVVVALIFALVVVLLIALLLGDEQDPTGLASQPATAAGACEKFGINTAVYTAPNTASYDRAARFNMGYALELVDNPSQLETVANSFNYAQQRGLKPILRACDASRETPESCTFSDAQLWATFVNDLADRVDGDFYALAGPNEPLSERWFLETPTDDVNVEAQALAEYMNTTINNVNRPNVRLVTPAYNMTAGPIEAPWFMEKMDLMSANGAQFDRLWGFSGNAYNVFPDARHTDYIARAKEAMDRNNMGGKPILLTESGMIEIDNAGTPRNQALENYREQIVQMKNDARIEGFLIFNGFGDNTDPSFAYNVVTDEELTFLTGQECAGGDVPPINPPINPPVDPPINPPVDPPINPPVDPPINPPIDEPVCGNGTPEAGEQCGEPGLNCFSDEICDVDTCTCELRPEPDPPPPQVPPSEPPPASDPPPPTPQPQPDPGQRLPETALPAEVSYIIAAVLLTAAGLILWFKYNKKT
jgi:hypothetical protein